MKDPWYKDGLNFKCQGCGKCCFGFPGYVWLTPADIKNISSHLALSINQFLDRYAKNVYGAFSLKEMKGPSYECIFYDNKRCKIYSVRPFQCRAYPFWPINMQSEESWEKNVKNLCQAACADHQLLHTQEEIDRLILEYKKELPF